MNCDKEKLKKEADELREQIQILQLMVAKKMETIRELQMKLAGIEDQMSEDKSSQMTFDDLLNK